MKKIILAAMLALVLVLSSFSVFADADRSLLSKVTGLSDDEIAELWTQGIGYGQLLPASALAERLDMDIEDLIALRKAGNSYYQIAEDKGVSNEDYKSDLLKKKNAYVDEQVKAGIITEEQGKLIKERMNGNIENCNGLTPGSGRATGGCGVGIGSGIGRPGMMGGLGRGRGF